MCRVERSRTCKHLFPKQVANLLVNYSTSNNKYTPEEAKMNMIKNPYVPQMMYENIKLLNVWNEYQNSFSY